MPRTSHADLVHDWQTVLTAVGESAPDLPHLEATRADLQTALDRALEIVNARASLRSQLTQLSRDLESTQIQGKDAAIKLRAGAKAKYGANSERLLLFRMKPLRRALRVERARRGKRKAAGGHPLSGTAPQQPSAER